MFRYFVAAALHPVFRAYQMPTSEPQTPLRQQQIIFTLYETHVYRVLEQEGGVACGFLHVLTQQILPHTVRP